MSGLDWGKLKAQGRCKDIGVPWTPEELHALFVLKIPAELVRQGKLSVQETSPDDGLILKTRRELKALASAEGLKYEENCNRAGLISLILSKTKTPSGSPLTSESAGK